MRISAKVRQDVLRRDNYTCQSCHAKLDPRVIGIKHIVPVSQGGSSDIENLVTVCPVCMMKMDRVIDLVTAPVSKQLARGWIYAFLRAPVATGVISSIALGVTVATIYTQYRHDMDRREKQRLESQSYAAQLTKLSDTEQRIHELLQFVTDQKESLKKTEDAVRALKEERDALAPLVESQQKIVDALFAAQERRNEQAVKKERWIGFGLGVGSSILASAIWTIARFFLAKKNEA